MDKRAGIFFKVSVILVFCVTLVISATSCIRFIGFKDSGEVTTKEFDIGEFNRLSFSSIGKIIIEQGDEESLTIEAEKNVINAISVRTVANRLNIGLKRGFAKVIPTKDVLFYLKVRDLSKIDLSGAGIVECDNLKTEKLSIDSSGLGSIKLNLIADSLEVEISGAGKIDITGKVNTQEIKITGAGSYDAKELISKDCIIDISGAGKAVVNVIQTLDVNISGIGSIEYNGSPTVTKNISGVGRTVKSVD